MVSLTDWAGSGAPQRNADGAKIGASGEAAEEEHTQEQSTTGGVRIRPEYSLSFYIPSSNADLVVLFT